MTYDCIMTVLKDITYLLTFIGGIYAIIRFYKLVPVVYINIVPYWMNDSRHFLVVKYEIENKARIRVYEPAIRIQILEHQIDNMRTTHRDLLILSEWVPFDKNSVRSEEEPLSWRDPELIHRNTRIYPGERISVERLYYISKDNVAVHIGMQVELPLGYIQKLIMGKTSVWRQTTTALIVK